ncbi:MAG: thioredoxin family protein [Deltaproteobacteria bacterium]|nr:thioredoxin family protein [Deltaproteobacteria bacterium]
MPGSFELERALAIGADAVPADPETGSLFMRNAARVPRPAADLGVELEALYSQSAVRPGDAFTGAIAVRGAFTLGEATPFASFAPTDSEALGLAVTGSRPHPYAEQGLLLTLRGEAATDGDEVSRLRGVLALRDAAYRPLWVQVDLPLPRERAGVEVAVRPAPWLEPLQATSGAGFFWRAILLALAGGLVLNLMPCVLPVLAIKVFGLADLAQRSPREVRMHGAAYGGGVVASMLVLAGFVVALRAGGMAVGWGFQFQEPLFLAVISTVLLVFGLNLFGVFEIGFDATRLAGLGASASGPRRSFFEGLLAVALATPCSAPFLGTAVGFAFASAPITIVAVFAAIGVGLASPYVVITLVPAWARWLPRSGAWMVWLRKLLGFALLATVVWLLWVAGRSAGTDAVSGLLAFLLAVGFAAWLYGALQSARLLRPARLTAVGATLAALLALPLLPLEPAAERGSPSASGLDPASLEFEPAAVRAAVERGRVAFVYFTADWCLTCKVNEHAVLASSEVRDAMRRLDVARFVGDWTRRDDRIRAELARFGRAGVPMYLVYSPGRPADPVVLPELLTVQVVVEALRAAAGEAGPLRAGRSTP